jgi:hypothetical protein
VTIERTTHFKEAVVVLVETVYVRQEAFLKSRRTSFPELSVLCCSRKHMIKFINGAEGKGVARRMHSSRAVIIKNSKRIDLKDRAYQEGGP